MLATLVPALPGWDRLAAAPGCAHENWRACFHCRVIQAGWIRHVASGRLRWSPGEANDGGSMTPEPKLAAMLVADEVFGNVLSYGQCVRTLRRLDFEGVTLYLAMLSQFNEAAFESVPLTDAAQVVHLRRMLACMLHGAALETAVRHLGGFSGRFVPLSTQALIATIELAGRFSPRTGRGLHLDRQERQAVTHVLLSLQAEALSRRLLMEFRTQAIADWAKVPKDAVEQFVRNMTAHNPNRPYANSLARLYAYTRKPGIAAHFASRTGRLLADWFTANLGMTGEDYLVGSFLAGASSTRFSLAAPDPNQVGFDPAVFFGPLPPAARERLTVLLRVATIDGLEPWAPHREANTLAELLYESNLLHATPVVRFGNRLVLTSATLLWNLFVCGLPHASLNAVRQRQAGPLTNQQVKGIRAEFGLLFEGYVLWLFREWFGDRPVHLLTNYTIRVGSAWRERDIAVIADGVAFVFEVKGHVVDLDLRKTGSFAGLKRLVGEPAEQAYLAAEAFLTGAVRTADGRPVSAVGRVVPVALVYDPIPLNLFTGDHFEPWLERALGTPVFTADRGRSGVLLLNIDDLETAEFRLRLDRFPERLLAALLMRADRPELRYERLDSLGSAAGGPRRPAPVALLGRDTDEFLERIGRSFLL